MRRSIATDLTQFHEVLASNGNKTLVESPCDKGATDTNPHFKPLLSPPAAIGSTLRGSPRPNCSPAQVRIQLTSNLINDIGGVREHAHCPDCAVDGSCPAYVLWRRRTCPFL